MVKLSVYIVTLNEELRLDKTLKAAKQVADEIVVVDSGSTDKTAEIAKKNGAKFLFHKWTKISTQKHFAQNKCANDWVLSLDADEVLTPELIEEIKILKKAPTADAYKFRICDMLPGDEKPRFFAKTYNQVRLYDRRKANMPDDLTHDRVVLEPDCRVIELKGKVAHYSYVTLYQLWFKLNMFTDELVQVALKENRKYSKLRLITEFPRQFLFYYFIRRYFLYGLCGFWMATSYAYFRFLKIAKWFEYQALHKK